VDSVRTIARKYPRLRSLFVPDHIDLDAATLNLLARCTMLQSVDVGRINGPGLVTLARAARQLRAVHVLVGLDGPSLIALAKACPNLEELTCISPPSGLDLEYFNDACALALAKTCKSLRRLGMHGSGYAFSDAAFVHLVKSCKHLVKLDLVGNILPTAIKRQLRRIAEDRNRPEFRIAENRNLHIKVVAQDGDVVFFSILSGTPVRILMDLYRRRLGVDADRFFEIARFEYNWEPLDPESTPEDLEMEDGDDIQFMNWSHEFLHGDDDEDDDDEA
jgi:small ubiquitin-related modifier